ncbi:MAG: hypothetical protein ACJAYU_002263 [Bradymonadia bacterium]|jgi:hypothetical protein
MLQAQSVGAYSAWLQRSQAKGEIVLPASLEVLAVYVEAQITMLLTQMAGDGDRELVKAHATLAFSAFATGETVGA